MNLILLHKEDLVVEGGDAYAVLEGRRHIHCQRVLKVKVRS